MNSACLVVGASGAIGHALSEALLEQGWTVCGTARHPDGSTAINSLKTLAPDRFHVIGMDLEDSSSIEHATEHVRAVPAPLKRVINAAGWLHDNEHTPEKRIQDLSPEAFERSFAVNATGTALLARHCLPLLREHSRALAQPSIFASLSARVGSISDNRRGGWYAYRAAKAAQNMIIKSLAIEMRQRGAAVYCVGLHPGTVSSPLSAPFLKRVPESQLKTPAESAAHLLTVLDELGPEHNGELIAWDGQIIPG